MSLEPAGVDGVQCDEIHGDPATSSTHLQLRLSRRALRYDPAALCGLPATPMPLTDGRYPPAESLLARRATIAVIVNGIAVGTLHTDEHGVADSAACLEAPVSVLDR